LSIRPGRENHIDTEAGELSLGFARPEVRIHQVKVRHPDVHPCLAVVNGKVDRDFRLAAAVTADQDDDALQPQTHPNASEIPSFQTRFVLE
jgi:hypothetical protein